MRAAAWGALTGTRGVQPGGECWETAFYFFLVFFFLIKKAGGGEGTHSNFPISSFIAKYKQTSKQQLFLLAFPARAGGG